MSSGGRCGVEKAMSSGRRRIVGGLGLGVSVRLLEDLPLALFGRELSEAAERPLQLEHLEAIKSRSIRAGEMRSRSPVG
jgi:hypothetical protein